MEESNSFNKDLLVEKYSGSVAASLREALTGRVFATEHDERLLSITPEEAFIQVVKHSKSDYGVSAMDAVLSWFNATIVKDNKRQKHSIPVIPQDALEHKCEGLQGWNEISRKTVQDDWILDIYGGDALHVVQFCPHCGAKLPESQSVSDKDLISQGRSFLL